MNQTNPISSQITAKPPPHIIAASAAALDFFFFENRPYSIGTRQPPTYAVALRVQTDMMSGSIIAKPSPKSPIARIDTFVTTTICLSGA